MWHTPHIGSPYRVPTQSPRTESPHRSSTQISHTEIPQRDPTKRTQIESPQKVPTHRNYTEFQDVVCQNLQILSKWFLKPENNDMHLQNFCKSCQIITDNWKCCEV